MPDSGLADVSVKAASPAGVGAKRKSLDRAEASPTIACVMAKVLSLAAAVDSKECLSRRIQLESRGAAEHLKATVHAVRVGSLP
jgi:hypothetical protein